MEQNEQTTIVKETPAASSQVYIQTAEEDNTPPITKARVIAHFRRHANWTAYMSATNDEPEMEYGFDWLGDRTFDFDKQQSSVLAHPASSSRYEYIEKHPYNFHPDINNSSTVETLTTDKRSSERDREFTPKSLPRGTTTSNDGTSAQTPETRQDETTGPYKVTSTKTSHTVDTAHPRTETSSFRYDDTKTIYTDIGNLPGDINKLKAAYQEGTTLKITASGDAYYASYLNLRYRKTIKLSFGINQPPPPATRPGETAPAVFGENEDELRLLPAPGFEDAFTIVPNRITKADLDAARGAVDISITNITRPLTAAVSIFAYHIDKNTPHGPDGGPLVTNRANLVGELRVLPNSRYYTLQCWLIKVKRKSLPAVPAIGSQPARPAVTYTDFTTGVGNYGRFKKDEIEKSLKRILAQANIEVLPLVEKELNDYAGPNVTSEDTSFADIELDAFLTQVANAQYPSPGYTDVQRQLLKGSYKIDKLVFIFLHDYDIATSAAMGAVGFSDIEHDPPEQGKANTTMVFKSADYFTIPHETTHSLGCHHTFTAIEMEHINFGRTSQNTKGVSFDARKKPQPHIFQKGRTDNLMDYDYGYQYDGATNIYFATTPTVTTSITMGGRPFDQKETIKNLYYKADAKYTNLKPATCTLFKWQWAIMQKDDELDPKTEIA